MLSFKNYSELQNLNEGFMSKLSDKLRQKDDEQSLKYIQQSLEIGGVKDYLFLLRQQPIDKVKKIREILKRNQDKLTPLQKEFAKKL